MKKAILVTSSASNELITKYKDFPLIGIEKGIEKIKKLNLKVALAISDFDTMPYEKALEIVPKNKVIKLSSQKDDSDTEAAIKKLLELGYDEFVILASLQKRYDHSHALLLLTKKYFPYQIYIEDDYNSITYFEKGDYTIARSSYRYFGVFGFPNAVVTMESSLYPMKRLKLDFVTTIAISNQLIERTAIFKVLKGGVLFVQSKER